jgi:hypothetical protein
MCIFCNKKGLKRYLYYCFLLQYEKRKLACRTLYVRMYVQFLCKTDMHSFACIFPFDSNLFIPSQYPQDVVYLLLLKLLE